MRWFNFLSPFERSFLFLLSLCSFLLFSFLLPLFSPLLCLLHSLVNSFVLCLSSFPPVYFYSSMLSPFLFLSSVCCHSFRSLSRNLLIFFFSFSCFFFFVFFFSSSFSGLFNKFVECLFRLCGKERWEKTNRHSSIITTYK